MQQGESLGIATFHLMFLNTFSALLSYQLVLKKVNVFIIPTVTPIYKNTH